MKQINIYLPPKDIVFAIFGGIIIGSIVADWVINL